MQQLPDMQHMDQTIDLAESAAVGSEPPPSRRQKFRAVCVSMGGFVLFYLLSSGPMAGLHRVFEVPGFQRAVELVYAPVVFLVKRNIEPFSSIMKWYVDLFR